MRAVDRVARLEADDALPAALGERRPRLRRVERELRERRLGPLEDGHAAGEVERLLRVEPGDAGMRVVGRAEAALGLALLVVLVGLVDLEHRERRPLVVGQRDLVAVRRASRPRGRRAAPTAARSRAASPRRRARSRARPMKPSSGESAPEASMSRSDSSREVSASCSSASTPSGPLARCGRRACRRAARSAVVPSSTGAHAVTSAGTRPSSSSLRDHELRALLRRRAARCRPRAPGSPAPRTGRDTP